MIYKQLLHLYMSTWSTAGSHPHAEMPPLFNLPFPLFNCQRKDEAICSAFSFLGVPLSTPSSSTLARSSSQAHLKPRSGKGNGITVVDLSVQDWLCCWEKGLLPLNSKKRWTPEWSQTSSTPTTTIKNRKCMLAVAAMSVCYNSSSFLQFDIYLWLFLSLI